MQAKNDEAAERPRLESVDSARRRAAIEEIKERAIEPTIVALGATRGTVRWHCFGPHKRGDRDASGTIRGGYYKCWSCGIHGDAIALLMDHRGLSFMDAGREAARLAGMQWPEMGDGAAVSHEHAVNRAAIGILERLATLWATSRRGDCRARTAAFLATYLSGAAAARRDELQERLRLGWACGNAAKLAERVAAAVPDEIRAAALERAGLVDGNGRPEKSFYAMCKGGGLVIPITRNGVVTQICVRRPADATPKDLVLPRRGRPAWGLDERRGKPIVLVEGEGDRIAVLAASDDVAPVACGTWLDGEGEAATRGRAALWREMERRRVYIGFDDDERGRACGGALAVALPGAYIVRWGAKDARDALNRGVLRVEAAIAGAETAATIGAIATKIYPDAIAGWRVDGDGLHRSYYDKKEKTWQWATVAPVAIWPVGLARDVNTGAVEMTLAWGAGRVRTAAIARSAALGGGIMALADVGAPVTDQNKRDVGKFILAAEAEWRLRDIARTRRLGWHGNTCVFGDRAIHLAGDGAAGGGRALHAAHTKQDVDAMMRDVAQCGDFETWRKLMLEACQASPVFSWLLYAAAASPLLERLGIDDSIIIHLWGLGRSSVGKTTAARGACSLWARPLAVKRGWNISVSKVEETAGTLYNFPYILDEVGQAAKRRDLGDMVYMIGNRRGREIAPVSHRQHRTAEWRNIVFSTGERPLLSARAFEGQRVRCWEIEDYPFEPDTSKDLVDRINELTERHYGWGSAWLATTAAVNWSDAVSAVRQFLCAEGGIGGRIADIGATIGAVGASLASFLGDDPASGASIASYFVGKMNEERLKEGDHGRRALEILLSDVARHRLSYTKTAPMGQRHGAISYEKEHLAILPTRVHEVLERAGYDSPTGLVRRWADEGVIDRGDGRHLQQNIRMDGAVTRCYVFPFESIKELITFEPPAPPGDPFSGGDDGAPTEA